jgi:hypothetical protein
MASFATRRVAAVLSERVGLQRVALEDDRQAYVLTQLTGPVAAGDDVVVNTTAVDLGLGTGGWDVVHWNLSRSSWSSPGPGHIMKLRYTSLQVDTGAAEDLHSDVLADVPDLSGRPVVACALHSQVAAAAAVTRHLAPEARLAYVMTDGAALPLALSDLVASLGEAGLLDVTVTAGQAFGGDLEAVNVPSAVALAVIVGDADVVIVGPGPGVVGTRTALGATAVEVASAVDVAAALGATPVVALRYSEVDERRRHQGISQTSLVALRLAGRAATLAVPTGPTGDRVAAELAGRPELAHHVLERIATPDVAVLLDKAGLAVTTMGRGPADDPGFFTLAGAAGAVAARVATEARR